MWGGRFNATQSDLMQEINQSITFDKKLFKQDIKGSTAHAKMLAKIGILTAAEAKKIIDALKKIEKEITSGEFNFKIELEVLAFILILFNRRHQEECCYVVFVGRKNRLNLPINRSLPAKTHERNQK